MLYIFLAAALGLASGQDAGGGSLVCMQPCRVPLWACIELGIPGHDIKRLQICVSEKIENGEVSDDACVTCYANIRLAPETTIFPTVSPTVFEESEPVEDVCPDLARRRLCQENTSCIWSDDTGCTMITDDNTPTPTVARGYIDEIKPCLTYCKDQAMACAFNHGITTTCIPCMRECVHEISFDPTPGNTLQSDTCGLCIEDVFKVLGDPDQPPDSGFQLFTDYQKFIANKGTPTRCTTAGGRWKVGRNKTRCVPPKGAKKLRCKQVTDMQVCLAVGCTDNKRKMRCAGANKWKTKSNN